MELGSEFELNIAELERVDDTIFNYLSTYHSIYTSSGRNAAKLLNRLLSGGRILLPSYICQSVIDVYKEKFTIEYYHVKKSFDIDLEDLHSKLSQDVAVVYLMHYFGKIQNQHILEFLSHMREKYHFLIIEDTTHSIFTCPNTIGDYCICSLRKWFPISDGGVVYSKRELFGIDAKALHQRIAYGKLDAMILKYSQIHRNVKCNDTYREIFQLEEEKLENEQEILGISCMSRMILNCISLKKMTMVRKRNLQYLRDGLDKTNIEIPIDEEYGVPLALPIYVNNRDDFRSYLIQNQIYCAVHWPVEDKELRNNKALTEMVTHIISLPLDQRYDGEHLDYMLSIIENYSMYVKNR